MSVQYQNPLWDVMLSIIYQQLSSSLREHQQLNLSRIVFFLSWCMFCSILELICGVISKQWWFKTEQIASTTAMKCKIVEIIEGERWIKVIFKECLMADILVVSVSISWWHEHIMMMILTNWRRMGKKLTE